MQATKRKCVILLLLLISINCLFGQNLYKILFLNTKSIMVGNTLYHVGDTIPSNKEIHWSHERQAMKVLDLQNKSQRVFVANKSLLQHSKSISSMLSSFHNLSTRTGEILTTFQLKEAIGNEILLTDAFTLEIGLKTDECHFFFISYYYNNELIYKKLPQQSGLFIIDRSIFSIDGILIAPFSTSIQIYYQNGDSRESISNDCHLNVIPLDI